MYNMNNMYYKPIRYSKGEILNGMQNYISNANGVAVSTIEKVEEVRPQIRHACWQGKLSLLKVGYFNVPEMGLSVPYYFCRACGKLLYYKDYM